MSLKRSVLIPLFLFVLFLVHAPAVLAANVVYTPLGGLESAAGGAGLGTKLTAPQIVGALINAVIGFTGLIFVILLVYAGILYMTASGDVDKVKKAKSMMIQAVIGIIIVVSAYAIASFVIDRIASAYNPTPTPPG